MKNIIPYGRQTITKHDVNAVTRVLQLPNLTQGPTIAVFEKKIAAYCGAKYAVVFNSGTAALHAAYFSAGLTAGDEFIISPMTFAATANAGLYLGAMPVFVDIEKKTGNIDAEKIENAITKNTKLIIPIHYGGNPVDLKKISTIAKKHHLLVVEDACHALGAEYEHTKIGACKFSDAAVFSFHAVKHITTGEGGAVTTNSEALYEKMRMFRTHGITKSNFQYKTEKDGGWYYEMQYLGFNYRLTDMQAALGISQLKKLDKFVRMRRKIAAIYDAAFHEQHFFKILKIKPDDVCAYHLYPILLNDQLKLKKKEIFEKLRKTGLWVQVHYIPIPDHPYYRGLGYKKGMCPAAEDFYEREISIPMFPTLKKNDIKYVIKTLFSVCRAYDL